MTTASLTAPLRRLICARCVMLVCMTSRLTFTRMTLSSIAGGTSNSSSWLARALHCAGLLALQYLRLDCGPLERILMRLRLSNVRSQMMAPAATLPWYVQYPSS